MKKILISGYYGFDNFGDEAILGVLVNHLRGNDITVLSSNPEKTGRTHNVNSLNSFNSQLIIERLPKFDMLISGGGSLLQNVTSNKSLFYYCGLINIMASLKTVAQNKKAHHDYFIEESFEAGIELCGTEVKSIRAGRVNLKDSWCSIVEGEIFVNGMHISPYDHGNIFNRDPMRVRKLLMHKKEINRLFGIVKQTGYSLIPISLYFKDSKVKVQVGLCKGKKLYDKREDMAKRSAKRDMERAIKEQNRF